MDYRDVVAVAVSGPEARDWRCRVQARNWYDAGTRACELAAEHHGFEARQYHVTAIHPEPKTS